MASTAKQPLSSGRPILAYMAGPWVFRSAPDIESFRQRVRDFCDGPLQGAIMPIFPMDPIVNLSRNGMPFTMDITDPVKIAAHCRRHIARCDVIVADVTPFRGVQPDPGTVLEIGFAHGAGKGVWLYSEKPIPRLRDRLWAEGLISVYISKDRDRDGYLIEDFGLPVDTMLSAYPYTVGCLPALEAVRDHYGNPAQHEMEASLVSSDGNQSC